MAEFIRVRDRDTKHEYHAPRTEVETNPDLYTVLDDEPVYAPADPIFHVPKATLAKK